MPESPDDSRSEFARLYQATVTPLRRYITRLLGNATEAEDVAHDAYARIYQQPADRPEALLYTTARRLAINRLKRRSISPISTTPLTDTAQSTAPDQTRQTIAREELALTEQAIAELPPGCRQVLLLRKVELLSHREIADRLGIAVSTVEKQHARALRLLRSALAERLDHMPDSTSANQEANQ